MATSTKTRRTKKERIIEALKRDRNASYADIAKETQSHPSYVQKVAKEAKLGRVTPGFDPGDMGWVSTVDVDPSMVRGGSMEFQLVQRMTHRADTDRRLRERGHEELYEPGTDDWQNDVGWEMAGAFAANRGKSDVLHYLRTTETTSGGDARWEDRTDVQQATYMLAQCIADEYKDDPQVVRALVASKACSHPEMLTDDVIGSDKKADRMILQKFSNDEDVVSDLARYSKSRRVRRRSKRQLQKLSRS